MSDHETEKRQHETAVERRGDLAISMNAQQYKAAAEALGRSIAASLGGSDIEHAAYTLDYIADQALAAALFAANCKAHSPQ